MASEVAAHRRERKVLPGDVEEADAARLDCGHRGFELRGHRIVEGEDPVRALGHPCRRARPRDLRSGVVRNSRVLSAVTRGPPRSVPNEGRCSADSDVGMVVALQRSDGSRAGLHGRGHQDERAVPSAARRTATSGATLFARVVAAPVVSCPAGQRTALRRRAASCSQSASNSSASCSITAPPSCSASTRVTARW